MPLSLSLMFWHLSLVNIVILLVCVSLFPCFLMTELSMDNHYPWILWINPLLHLDRCIHFSPGKTHPCCSHSLCCIFTIFSSSSTSVYWNYTYELTQVSVGGNEDLFLSLMTFNTSSSVSVVHRRIVSS